MLLNLIKYWKEKKTVSVCPDFNKITRFASALYFFLILGEHVLIRTMTKSRCQNVMKKNNKTNISLG